jgi:uncharacterized protein (UPF0210 family)
MVKKGGVMASTHVGGFSEAFIPISEDEDMVAAVRSGSISLDKDAFVPPSLAILKLILHILWE